MSTEGQEKFLAENPHLKDFMGYLYGLNNESERGLVLITAAMLDDLLEQTIGAFLISGADHKKLFEGASSPLSSFSAKCEIAYSLALISEREYSEIQTIRKLRNKFAHSFTGSFEDQSIKDMCSNLSYAIQQEAVDQVAVHAKIDDLKKVNTRMQFTTAAVSLILNLVNRAAHVKHKQLSFEGWPY